MRLISGYVKYNIAKKKPGQRGIFTRLWAKEEDREYFID